MKKTILTILATLLLSLTANAQDIYDHIHKTAQQAVDNPQTNAMVRQINQFKVDALDYLIIKMREQMPDSTAQFLDKQAYAMNNFIGIYIQKIIECRDLPDAQQKKVMQLFMDASFSNPLFKDPDTELTQSYTNAADGLIHFSLDTDWRRAAAAVAIELKITQ